MSRFCHYQLRTTDIAAARAFYTTFVDQPLDIVALPDAARAAGAPAHWLGLVGVDDVAATAEAFVARGAARLGPQRSDLAILRDPGGAVVALAPPRPRTLSMWHVLNAADAECVAAVYAAILGWSLDGSDAGTIVDIAGRPGVHPHWCFFFVVDDFEAALAAARAGAAKVLGPTPLPDGRRVAVCDDPQGAAFGLMGGLPTS